MMSLGTICPQGCYNTIDHNSYAVCHIPMTCCITGGLYLLTPVTPSPWASQVVLVVKNRPVNAGDEDPLDKEMATHSSILA